MKICVVCKKSKPLVEFNKNRTKKDGLQIHCRDCNKARAKAYYAKRTPEHIAVCIKINRERIRANQAQMVEWLLDHPCTDCGETDPIVLDLDHVRGQKEHNVSQMVLEGYSWARISTEISRCEVRCANCHRRKTAKERNLYRYRLRSSIG